MAAPAVAAAAPVAIKYVPESESWETATEAAAYAQLSASGNTLLPNEIFRQNARAFNPTVELNRLWMRAELFKGRVDQKDDINAFGYAMMTFTMLIPCTMCPHDFAWIARRFSNRELTAVETATPIASASYGRAGGAQIAETHARMAVWSAERARRSALLVERRTIDASGVFDLVAITDRDSARLVTQFASGAITARQPLLGRNRAPLSKAEQLERLFEQLSVIAPQDNDTERRAGAAMRVAYGLSQLDENGRPFRNTIEYLEARNRMSRAGIHKRQADADTSANNKKRRDDE